MPVLGVLLIVLAIPLFVFYYGNSPEKRNRLHIWLGGVMAGLGVLLLMAR